MENEFYKDEFEQFLQQQANNHRMYPSDGVWLGIYKKLHGDKKWPGLTITAFAFLIATIAISLYFAPKPNIFEIDNNQVSQKQTSKNNLTGTPNTPLLSSLINTFKADKENAWLNHGTKDNSASNATIVAPDISEGESSAQNKDVADVAIEAKNRAAENVAKQTPSRAVFAPQKQPDFANNEISLTEELKPDQILNEGSPAISLNENKPMEQKVNGLPKTIKPNANSKEKDRDDKNLADNFLKQHSGDLELYTKTRQINQKNKFSYTVYITPSASYRNLKDENILNRKNVNVTGPVALNYVADVNKVVRHKPGTGIEAGFALTYHITNTLGISSGLQFNVRQYNIEAYKSPYEATTIALRSNNRTDTINAYSVYSNTNGYLSTNLVNRYYQFSVPVGLQWEVIGNKNVRFTIAASIQPTYVVNSNSYLLSSNFKNYTSNSNILRNWNINSSVEAFMSIKLGDYRWQLGPQFRYQHLPTLLSEYPIHEHLTDYGFKIGVSKFIK